MPFFSQRIASCKKNINCKEKTPTVSKKTSPNVVRPEKWDDSQVWLWGSNASVGRFVLLPPASWAHGASKMATLGASLLPVFTVFQSLGGHASASRVAHEPCFGQARCFVQGPLRLPRGPQIAHAPSHIWAFSHKTETKIGRRAFSSSEGVVGSAHHELAC